MGDRDYYIQQQPSRRPLLGATNNALVMLIAINAVLFIILNFLNLVYKVSAVNVFVGDSNFHTQVLDWFILPAQAGKLATRPWTILLYMFTNYDVMMLISNLLWLWSFGYIFQDLAGNRKLIPVYLYGGLAGSVFFLLSVNFVPYLHSNIASFQPLVGSGAAVMAVAVATTTVAPDYRIFPMLNGGIPLWVLTVIFIIIDFASVGSYTGGVAIAHLSGAAMGFIFIKLMAKGIDIGEWMNRFADWVNDLFNPEKKHATDTGKHFYKADKVPYQKTANVTQQRLDDILDKINVHGYAMLTDDEKEFLKRASKEEL